MKLHRLIANCPDGMVVDHINRRTLDNRRCNLRVCTQSENLQNMKKNKKNTSGYSNIHLTKDGYWRFQKNIQGKRYSYANKNIDKVIEYKEKFLTVFCPL